MAINKLFSENEYAVAFEEHAYFIGSYFECAAYIKGYNCRADLEGEETVFDILPCESVKISKGTT